MTATCAHRMTQVLDKVCDGIDIKKLLVALDLR